MNEATLTQGVKKFGFEGGHSRFFSLIKRLLLLVWSLESNMLSAMPGAPQKGLRIVGLAKFLKEFTTAFARKGRKLAENQKKSILAVGLMSGTSCDGVDAALIESDGEGAVRPIASVFRPYQSAGAGPVATGAGGWQKP
ncbi:hypothetical protein [uncultured Cohaesibacter sp.]|uniref:hypothetical protein n=1 Tax=uncultured Cohaesibacter sp. TaxID=1002546 RepID=UPI0029C761B4|nr:hypothetical protein [uncultured Cohaesibacter sp.]